MKVILPVDNTEVITGHAEKSIFSANQLAIGYLESPRFPEAYPRLLQKNYTLLNENPNGFVRLIFDDFHVHYLSELRVNYLFELHRRFLIFTKNYYFA